MEKISDEELVEFLRGNAVYCKSCSSEIQKCSDCNVFKDYKLFYYYLNKDESLLDCRACKIKPEIEEKECIHDWDHTITGYYIQCSECGIRTEVYENKDKAILAWNKVME